MLKLIRRMFVWGIVLFTSLFIGISIPLANFVCSSTSGDQQTSTTINSVLDVNAFILSDIKPELKHEENIPRKDKKLVFLGLISSDQFFDSRIPAVFNTWAKNIPGEVTVFGRENAKEIPENIPIVRLEGVDDSYPPQKKSFSMFKYMYDYHLDDFEFFVRADDDVYIRPDKLEEFLKSINSSEAFYIGQMGKGVPAEYGKLDIGEDENFCMGGPGVILTRSTLAKIGPYITKCLESMYSSHEDTEVGRCIQKYAGISCTWNYEMKYLMINLMSPFGLEGNLKSLDLYKPISIHPFKNPLHMYQLHNYINEHSLKDYETELISIMKELSNLSDSQRISFPVIDEIHSGNFFSDLGWTTHSGDSCSERPRSEYTVHPYSLINTQEYSSLTMNPHFYLSPSLKINIDETTNFFLNENYEKGKTSSEGETKLQRFGNLYSKFELGSGFPQQIQYRFFYNYTREKSKEGNVNAQIPLGSLQVQEYTKEKENINKDMVSNDEIVHFILPLSDRYIVFKRFMDNYEKAFLKPKEAVTLTIVIYSQENEEKNDALTLVKRFQEAYSHAVFKIIQGEGTFARLKALQKAADQWTSECLLFFIDVYIHFKPDVLDRIRQLTKRGKQVFFPVIFSEFDPSASGEPPRDEQGHVQITEDSGYFRTYSYGMFSIYKSDLEKFGRLNSSSVELDIYKKIVSNNSLVLFRTVETSLSLMFRPPDCLSTIDKTATDCLSALYTMHSSLSSVVRRVTSNPDVLDQLSMKTKSKISRI